MPAVNETMRRHRNTEIVAALGPASSDAAPIRALFEASADVFRLNFRHGEQAQHKERMDIIRGIERETGRPSSTPSTTAGKART